MSYSTGWGRCEHSVAAVVNPHKLCSFGQHRFVTEQFWRTGARNGAHGASSFLREASGENLSPASPASGEAHTPWLVAPST